MNIRIIDQTKLDLINTCKELYDLRLVNSTSGNVSFINQNVIYITSTGTNLGRVKYEDIAEVDVGTGEKIFNEPSKEIDGHMAIYRQHKDVNAVVHVHGNYISAYTCIAEPEGDYYPVMYSAPAMKISDRIFTMEYFHPYLPDNYQRFEKIAKHHKIFFHQNHGIFIGAKSLEDAKNKAEILEENLRIYFTLKSLNIKFNELSQEEKTELFTKSYIK